MKKWLLCLSPYIFFLLFRIPTFFDPYYYVDNGIYAAIGEGLTHGLVLYKNLYDNKTPGIYYLYALLEKLHIDLNFLIQSLSIVAGVVSLYLLFKITKKLFLNDLLSYVSSFIFAFLIGSTIFAGNLANVENFLLPFALYSIYLIIKNKEKLSLFVIYLAGLILGLGLLFKFTIIFDGGFLCITFLFLYGFIRFVKYSIIYILGLITPIGIFLIWEFLIHNFHTAFYIMFLGNVRYVGYDTSGYKYIIINFISLLILLTILFILYKKKIARENITLVIIWFMFEYFGSLFSGRPYWHYLVLTSASLSVLASYIILIPYNIKLVFRLLIIFVFLSLVYFLGLYFLRTENMANIKAQFIKDYKYYTNFIEFASGKIDRKEYFSSTYFKYNTNVAYEKHPSSSNIMYSLSNTILSVYNVRNKPIFIWGNFPWVYYITGSYPAGRIVADFASPYPSSILKKLTFKAIENATPVVIVTYKDGYKFPGLFRYIAQNYVYSKSTDGANIYILKTLSNFHVSP